jgi:hypothetical protein
MISFLISCVTQKKLEPKDEKNSSFLDSIPEKTNPKNLNLTKNQFFIDTTRNSRFFKKLLAWKASDKDKDLIILEINNNKKKVDSKFELRSFPKVYMQIQKFKDEFLFYDQCDGDLARFEIRNNVFVFYGMHETIVQPIENLSESENEITIKLRMFNSDSTVSFSSVQIKRSAFNNIYELIYERDSLKIFNYVVQPKYIQEFNLMVNYCPLEKVPEYDGFDKLLD